MNLVFTEEQEAIRSTARELLADRCPMSHVRAMADDPAGYSSGLWKEMVELGWTALALPEEHGGLGEGFLELCLLIEELGRFQTPSPFVPTVVWSGLPLARFGTDDQKQRYLPPIARGERILTACGFGWGPEEAPVATRDGDGYVLGGSVMFVPYANVADALVVVARGEDGEPRVLVVAADAQGVTAERLETVRAIPEHRVDLDGVRVEAAGEIPAGAAQAIRDLGAVAACVEMVGGAQRVLDMTVSYATERQQFGKPVGSFQAIQHHCANMASDVLGARLIAYEAAWRLSEGLEASEEVSLAKAWVGDAYRRVCGLGHQVHGAMGFTQEYDLHYYYRHAMAADLAFGDAGHHTELVARHIGL